MATTCVYIVVNLTTKNTEIFTKCTKIFISPLFYLDNDQGNMLQYLEMSGCVSSDQVVPLCTASPHSAALRLRALRCNRV